MTGPLPEPPRDDVWRVAGREPELDRAKEEIKEPAGSYEREVHRDSDPGPGVRLVGVSLAMQKVRALIARFARTELAVHIHGPTGVGKELVARAIHAQSGVRGRFVAFNVCAISESMFEAALFGHVRGAYTGAVGESTGYIREADNGTLFMDEIASLPEQSQPKLLRALELREFRRVGASNDSRSNFRLVSASNESLAELSAKGKFRDDLLHRLQGAVIQIPPLNSRPEDIPPLVLHILDGLPGRGGSRRSIEPSAINLLAQRSWPGNVRELIQVLHCAVALSEGNDITSSLIEEALESRDPARPKVSTVDATRLRAVMRMAQGHVSTAAEMIGVHRSTVYRWLRRAGLGPSGEVR